MEPLQEYKAIMDEYVEAVNELQKKRKFLDGLFGFGSHPGNAACHEILDQKVEALCRKAGEALDASEQASLADAVLRSERAWQGPEYARLMMAAIQRHVIPLLPSLSPETKKELLTWYEKEYPRWKRLPVQDQVISALKK